MNSIRPHSSAESASSIYKGKIRHRRFAPKSHAFEYQITMLMLDLDFVHLDLAFPPIMSARAPAIGWFRRKDYAGPTSINLKEHILEQVERQTGNRPNGKVLLLTHLRYWGFVMNPITIFYCYDTEGTLVSSVLQVTNTPWREKILYILPVNPESKNQVSVFSKEMHVSPFNPMDMQYLCRLKRPDKTLFFHLENLAGKQKVMDATMVFKRQPVSRFQLVKLVLTQPAMTIRVGVGIYWQAVKLWLKKVPVYDHPGASDQRANKINPTTVRRSE